MADLAADVPGLEVTGFVENWERERARGTLHGRPIHWIDDLGALSGGHVAVCALVTPKRVHFTDQVDRHGIPWATLVHPSAHVSRTSPPGAGAIVSAGAIVGAHTAIGRHALLNRGVLVGHHAALGDHATLLPGANVAGNCRVGARAVIGMGALVLDNLEVGHDAVVAAGAVVTRNVPPGTKVMGVPAREVP